MSPLDETLRALVRDAVREALEDVLPRLQASTVTDTHKGRYLTTEEAAEVARVKTDTIRDWLKTGELQRHGTPRHLLVRLDQLEIFLAADAMVKGEPTDAEIEARVDELMERRATRKARVQG